MEPLTVKLEDFTRSAKARVLSIYDGDTLKVAILVKKTRMKDQDLGYHIHIENGWVTLHTPVRLFGINAPEMSVPEGVVARDFLRSELEIGSLVTLKTALNPADKYGRWLGIVYKGRKNMNRAMEKTGHAISYLL